jgi:hypothetical protein
LLLLMLLLLDRARQALSKVAKGEFLVLYRKVLLRLFAHAAHDVRVRHREDTCVFQQVCVFQQLEVFAQRVKHLVRVIGLGLGLGLG